MTADLRLGLIGAGRWGRIYIKTLDAQPGVRLHRLASGNPQSRNLVSSDCQISEDWRTLVSAGDLDGLIIATPPALHAEMATAAIAVGLPVLIEKPLTLDAAEAEAVLAIACQQPAAIALVDHIHLYHPAYVALKHHGLGCGAVHAIRSVGGDWGPFRSDASVLWDRASHDVAMCLDLIGSDPVEISARRVDRRQTDDGFGETVIIRLIFENGVVADIEAGNLMARKTRFFAVHYDRETLIYDDESATPLVREPRPDGACDPAGAEIIGVSDQLPLGCTVQAFADAIRRGEEDLSGLELGVRVVRVLAACDTALRDAGNSVSSRP